jgi:hypothetical protein
MRQKSNSSPVTSEKFVRNIRRATRKHHAAEEKIRIVLDGLRGENCIPIAPLISVGRPEDEHQHGTHVRLRSDRKPLDPSSWHMHRNIWRLHYRRRDHLVHISAFASASALIVKLRNTPPAGQDRAEGEIGLNRNERAKAW